MAEFEERRWTAPDGLSLYARDYAGAGGSARLPVMCLHGLTRNSRDFAALAPLIAASGRRVIVPDVRGRGLSDRDPYPSHYTPPTYARDVLALMASLGMSRAVFLGTSMGGIIMMFLAARHGRRMAAAILNDVGPEVAPEGLARIKAYAGKDAKVESWADAEAYVRGTSAAAFPHFGPEDWRRFARTTFREQPDGRPAFDYDPAIAVPLAKGGGKAPSLLAWLLFRRLARRPTLAIRGATSDILSSITLAKMRSRAPHLKVTEVPGVGHAPMLDEPQAVEAILSFLEGVP